MGVFRCVAEYMDFEIFIVKVDQFNRTSGHIPRYMYVIQVVNQA